MIPSGAVRREDDERFVYVDQAGTLTKRPVTIGTREGGVTEIKKGLDTADRVLIGPAPDASGKS